MPAFLFSSEQLSMWYG